MTTHTGTSNSTFADVLTKLVIEEQVTQSAKSLDFSMGCLCKVCKDVVSTFDRLQHELFDVKSLILGWIANIEHFGEKNMEKRTEKKLNEEECTSKSKGKKTPRKEVTNGHASQNIIIRSKRATKETPKFKEYKTASDKDKLITIDDEVYNVEALLEKRGYKYLVKWENYPEVYNSWEPRFALPEHIVKVDIYCIFMYKDLTLYYYVSTMKRI
jgi:hypothetical protein